MREKERTPFAQRLVAARTRAGLSQPQLAKLVGMAQGTLGEAETTAIGSKYTAQLAGILKVRAEWLASGEGPMLDVGWPFARIDLSRVLRLSPSDLAYVEGRLEAAIEKVEQAQGESPTEATDQQDKPPPSATRGTARTDELFNLTGGVKREGNKSRRSQKQGGSGNLPGAGRTGR
jgi:transcriptional regulator with XRE-family HTH domain